VDFRLRRHQTDSRRRKCVATGFLPHPVMSPSRPAATRHWAGSECEKALLGRGAFSGLGRFDAPAAVWRDILGGRDVVEEVGCCDRRAGWCAWPEHELEFWQRGNPLGVRAPYTGAILPWRRRPPWFGVSRP